MKRLILIIVFLPSCLFPQAWSGILDPTRAIDWSQAGATHINDVRTLCTTSACNTVTGGSVTAATINAAILTMTSGQYLQIPSGSFTLSGCILVQPAHQGITLRGMGASSTLLIFSSASCSYSSGTANILAVSNDTSGRSAPANIANWTASSLTSTLTVGTYTRFSSFIQLSSKTALSIGSQVVLDQLDLNADPGNVALYVGCEFGTANGGTDTSPACYQDGFPGGYTRGNNTVGLMRGQQQVVNVTSITGTGPYTIGISPGIYADNWDGGATGLLDQKPQAWWSSSPVADVGFENFSIVPSSSTYAALWWRNCTGCWAKGIAVNGANTSAPGTPWMGIAYEMCNHCTTQDSYFFANNVTDSYVVGLDGGSDNLTVNTIMQNPGSTAFTSADCEGCVAIYNFGVNPRYVSSNAWSTQSNDNHAYVMFMLTEGNIGTGLYSDSFHGTHVLDTYFRNRMDGQQQNCNGIGSGSPNPPVAAGCTLANTHTIPIILNPGARQHNLLGNVLGTPGYHNKYLTTPSSTTNENTSIINAGYYPEGKFGTVLDSLPYPTSMFWGNWDTVHGSQQFNSAEVPTGLPAYSNAVPGSTTLPASFFYSSKPSWWPSSKTWPPVHPESTTGGNVGQCAGGIYQTSEVNSGSLCSGGTFSTIGGGLVTSIPAMDCYLNVMGGPPTGTGSALSFDASVCYPANATTTPVAPSATIFSMLRGNK